MGQILKHLGQPKVTEKSEGQMHFYRNLKNKAIETWSWTVSASYAKNWCADKVMYGHRHMDKVMYSVTYEVRREHANSEEMFGRSNQ